MLWKALCPVLIVLAALTANQALAWDIVQMGTATPDWGADGRIYMPDGATLAPTGALVQLIIDVDGDGFDDPGMYFSSRSPEELLAWIQGGCDPGAYSDDVLAAGPGFDGMVSLCLPGQVEEAPAYPGYTVTAGSVGAQFGWRAFSLSLAELETIDSIRRLDEIWYTTCAEVNGDGSPWTIEAMDLWSWDGYIGMQVYRGDKARNTLDTLLAGDTGPVVPEPGTMLLFGSSALLLVLRRKK